MPNNNYLPFISNKDLIQHVRHVIDMVNSATEDAEEKLYSNTIDPFSALFDASLQGISLSAWLKQEKSRQIQKTLQNAIGEFHQSVIGSMPGWEDLGRGEVVDLRNRRKKMIAEVKNKYNTTKGNHKKAIYNDLQSLLQTAEYKGFTGYYVEIIPPRKRRYNKPFAPSDNVTHTRLPENEKIRQIDGFSFYHLITGKPNALRMLYYALPDVISEVTGQDHTGLLRDRKFSNISSDISKVDGVDNSSIAMDSKHFNLFDKAY